MILLLGIDLKSKAMAIFVPSELIAATKGLGYMLQIARTIGRLNIIVMRMLVFEYAYGGLEEVLNLLS